jgi:hypothetical protein
MVTQSKTPAVKVKLGEFECPGCGSSDWFSFVEAYSTIFGPAEVVVLPDAISITVLRRDEKRYSEDDPRLECQNCDYVISVDEIMPDAVVCTSRPCQS